MSEHFDADQYLRSGRTITLGGRLFEVPIVPAITAGVIAKNAEAYKRFGTTEQDDESVLVACRVLASILNQRLPVMERVDADWVANNIDMRMIAKVTSHLFGETKPEKKSKAEASADVPSDGKKLSTESSATTDGSPPTSSME